MNLPLFAAGLAVLIIGAQALAWRTKTCAIFRHHAVGRRPDCRLFRHQRARADRCGAILLAGQDELALGNVVGAWAKYRRPARA